MNPKGNPQNLTPFEPGQTGNPGGKPVASRNRLTAKFLYELAADFDVHGRSAITECREKKPDVYIRAIAALCPKEVEIKAPLQELEDEQLLAAVRALEGFLAARSVEGGDSQASGPEQLN